MPEPERRRRGDTLITRRRPVPWLVVAAFVAGVSVTAVVFVVAQSDQSQSEKANDESSSDSDTPAAATAAEIASTGPCDADALLMTIQLGLGTRDPEHDIGCDADLKFGKVLNTTADDWTLVGGVGGDYTAAIREFPPVADGAIVQGIRVRFLGLQEFSTVTGANATIPAFKYLGRTQKSQTARKTVHGPSGRGTLEVEPDEARRTDRASRATRHQPTEVGVKECDALIRMFLSCSSLPAGAHEGWLGAADEWKQEVDSGGGSARARLKAYCRDQIPGATHAVRYWGCAVPPKP